MNGLTCVACDVESEPDESSEAVEGCPTGMYFNAMCFKGFSFSVCNNVKVSQ